MKEIISIKSIAQAHQIFGLEKPKHPLVSVIRYEKKHLDSSKHNYKGVRFAVDLFQISLKNGVQCTLGYGRNSYDFQDGSMMFTSPGQVISVGEEEKEYSEDSNGWTLLFHPDLIRKSELGKTIDNYTFFSYDVHEALHLSEDEKKTVTELSDKIEKEYNQNIDRHSQNLIISNIELLLGYSTRYYDRQFYVRTNLNKDIISKFEQLLKDYYNSEKVLELGIPTVKYCGTELNMSSNYLSDLLKKETGKNAQEHIHHYLIEKAKNSLLGSTDSVSQIAYSLGFEYPQHFSKVFKLKTGMSPAQYRSVS